MTNTGPFPLSNAKRIELSEIVDASNDIVETHEDRLRRRTLTPLVWYFIVANAVVDVLIFAFAFLERIYPSFGDHMITDKVIMALIAGNTVQVAAMIVAAFRGLFDAKKGGKGKGKKGGRSPASEPVQPTAPAPRTRSRRQIPRDQEPPST